ncbi:MFS family permease [Alkalibacillus filiformis]|uniref:MFS family permease n=1 Tax=Alkalibacillus filiformis TaxID=200990 RepID=A0ABU0DT96_9BACI|nr:MFS transporter [Alkalibacillus filiformis]MDQ0351506.1 MFS family permease [Alkalibacillus filiformis]
MKGYKNLLVTFFLSEFARAMYFITVTWLLYQLTYDGLYTGLLVGLGFLPGLLLNVFFGVIVDRFDRKKLAVSANLICTITMLILLFFVAINSVMPLVIIGVHMILQASGSLFRPAIQAYIAECFERDNLPKVFSQSSSVAIVGGLLGASVGGLIISFISIIGSMLIVAGSFALGSISLVFVRKQINREPIVTKRNSIIKDIADGFIYIKNNKFLLGLLIIMFNGQLVFHTSLGFLSVYTVDYLLQSATVYGLLDATISIGGALAGLLGTWWLNRNKNKTAIYSLLVVLIGLFLVGVAPILAMSFLGVFLIGLGTTWIRVLLQSIQQMATDSDYHGRMASYRMIGNQGAVVISAPILGWIASSHGANYVFLTLMVPISLCIIFAFHQSKQEKLITITKKVA